MMMFPNSRGTISGSRVSTQLQPGEHHELRDHDRRVRAPSARTAARGRSRSCRAAGAWPARTRRAREVNVPMMVTLSATMRLFLKPAGSGPRSTSARRCPTARGSAPTPGAARRPALRLQRRREHPEQRREHHDRPGGEQGEQGGVAEPALRAGRRCAALSRQRRVRRVPASSGSWPWLRLRSFLHSPQSMLKLLRRLRRNWIKVMTNTSSPRTIAIAVA